MLSALLSSWKILGSWVQQHIKRWSKPTAVALAAGAISDLSRSRTDLLVENAMLRQQLIVLNRQVKQPKLTNANRVRIVLLARCTRFWKSALHIVQPDTVLRWHRDLFRRYWKRKSKPKRRKPCISQETVDLIRQMALENRTWGAERIRGELLKLGIKVSKRTIQKHMHKVRRQPSQTWATFLKNHAGDIWACDFTVVHDLLFRAFYIFVIIELKTRRIVHTAVTTSPTDAWTARQLREATPWGEAPKYLIRDNDSKYGEQFTAVARSTGIEELKTPFHAPKANAICERCIGSLKRECLDHLLIFHRNQLRRVVTEYADYHNRARPHQGIGQRIPARHGKRQPAQSGKIKATPVLGGLHHSYSRVTYPS